MPASASRKAKREAIRELTLLRTNLLHHLDANNVRLQQQQQPSPSQRDPLYDAAMSEAAAAAQSLADTAARLRGTPNAERTQMLSSGFSPPRSSAAMMSDADDDEDAWERLLMRHTPHALAHRQAMPAEQRQVAHAQPYFTANVTSPAPLGLHGSLQSQHPPRGEETTSSPHILQRIEARLEALEIATATRAHSSRRFVSPPAAYDSESDVEMDGTSSWQMQELVNRMHALEQMSVQRSGAHSTTGARHAHRASSAFPSPVVSTAPSVQTESQLTSSPLAVMRADSQQMPSSRVAGGKGPSSLLESLRREVVAEKANMRREGIRRYREQQQRLAQQKSVSTTKERDLSESDASSSASELGCVESDDGIGDDRIALQPTPAPVEPPKPAAVPPLTKHAAVPPPPKPAAVPPPPKPAAKSSTTAGPSLAIDMENNPMIDLPSAPPDLPPSPPESPPPPPKPSPPAPPPKPAVNTSSQAPSSATPKPPPPPPPPPPKPSAFPKATPTPSTPPTASSTASPKPPPSPPPPPPPPPPKSNPSKPLPKAPAPNLNPKLGFKVKTLDLGLENDEPSARKPVRPPQPSKAKAGGPPPPPPKPKTSPPSFPNKPSPPPPPSKTAGVPSPPAPPLPPPPPPPPKVKAAPPPPPPKKPSPPAPPPRSAGAPAPPPPPPPPPPPKPKAPAASGGAGITMDALPSGGNYQMRGGDTWYVHPSAGAWRQDPQGKFHAGMPPESALTRLRKKSQENR
ncbi:hypothetical protein RI054_18g81560 [Pseudoscourfieldia marina]